MASPFPGMDPYLEGSEWGSVHAELSSEIVPQLSPKLRSKYLVRLPRRFVTGMPDDVGIMTGVMFPDVSISGFEHQDTMTAGEVTMISAPLQMAAVMPARVPHHFNSFSSTLRTARTQATTSLKYSYAAPKSNNTTHATSGPLQSEVHIKTCLSSKLVST